MSFRNTAILAVLVAAFGAYLYLVELPAADREGRPTTILEFEPDEITGVDLESAGTRIELRRRDSQWWIMAPRELAADGTSVDALLRGLSEAEEQRAIAEPANELGAFGLGPEARRISLHRDGETALPPVRIGNETPIGRNAYVQRDGETDVLLTAGTIRSLTDKDLDDLRSKQVWTIRPTEVTRLELRTAQNAPIVLEKNGEVLELRQPVLARGDQRQIQSYLSALESLRATGFIDTVDGESIPDSLSTPALTIQVTQGDSPPQTLLVGAAATSEPNAPLHLRIEGNPTVYEVGGHLRATLEKDAAAFRDKRIIRLGAADDLRALQIVREDGEFRLQREGDRWQLTDQTIAETFAADRFAADVREVEGSAIVHETAPADALGFDRPTLEIALLGEDDRSLGVLIFRREDDVILARAEGSPLVYSLPDYVYNRIDKRESDFAPPKPTTAPSTPSGESEPDA